MLLALITLGAFCLLQLVLDVVQMRWISYLDKKIDGLCGYVHHSEAGRWQG